MTMDTTAIFLISILLGASVASNVYLYRMWQDAEQRVEWLERALVTKVPPSQMTTFDISEMFGENED
jgi:hypothetical protein